MLRAGPATVEFSPEGGRIVSLTLDGRELLFPPSADPIVGGLYPMAPFAGRIRRGRLTFEGRTWDLPINLPPHAIHGTVFTRTWRQDGDEWATDLGADWPFAGEAAQTVRLFADRLELTLEVRAAERMPVTLGWHPWFVGGILQARPVEMLRRDADGIPDGVRVTAPPGPWDDCFVLGESPTIDFGGRTVRLESDCDWWVIYDQRPDTFCVEPQSGLPDAANLGLATVLAAGERLKRSFLLRWD